MCARLLFALAALALAGCARDEPPCPLPRTHIVSGAASSGVPPSWVKAAWSSSIVRLRNFDVCAAADGAEVWLRYHRDDPLLCVGRPPYYTCTVPGHAPRVYYVEVNLEAPGAQTVYDLLAHEFLHVLMYELGAPRAAHHPAMSTSGWYIRRTAW